MEILVGGGLLPSHSSTPQRIRIAFLPGRMIHPNTHASLEWGSDALPQKNPNAGMNRASFLLMEQKGWVPGGIAFLMSMPHPMPSPTT
jgi:hypothetical protein